MGGIPEPVREESSASTQSEALSPRGGRAEVSPRVVIGSLLQWVVAFSILVLLALVGLYLARSCSQGVNC